MRSLGLWLSAFFLYSASNTAAQIAQPLPFDSTAKIVVIDFLIEGNKVTQERIILRELTFAVGDSLYLGNLEAGMEQSRNNIMNLRLFNFVEVQSVLISDQQVIVLISVIERWYIYPVPILELAQTNFNTWWETKELRWLNYGMSVTHNNFRGRNERLSLIARFGYTKRFGGSYSIPNLNRRQTLGISFSANYFENDEIVFNTEDNRRLFYNNPEDKARKFMQYGVGLSYRENIYTTHSLSVSYFDARVNDTIPVLQPDYFTGGVNRTRFMRASYVLTYDTRDYRRYPLKGLMLQGLVQQDGLGIINREGLNLFTTSFAYRHHWQIEDRLYYGHGLTTKINWERPPYYLMRGLGYGDWVRGYEYYVIDGTHTALIQTNLKYTLLKPKTISLPFVPTKKFSETFVAFYLNWFIDMGYVNGADFRERNSLVNEYLYSTGVGLDMVTYYDRVFRVEGTVNALGEFGIFLHLKQAF